jgi:predicted TIM-barrel fold metal-dependent hydrolase
MKHHYGMGDENKMIIDCDVHHSRKGKYDLAEYLPEPWKSEILRYGERTLGAGILQQEGGNRWDLKAPDGGGAGTDPAFMKQQLLDKYNYSYAILTGSGHHITGVPDPDYAAAMCSAYNDHTIDRWLPQDERFRSVIWLAHQDPPAAARELERLGDHPGMVMGWFSSTSRVPFGQRFYYPIYEVAERKGLPIGIHPGQANAMMAQAASTAAGMARTYLEFHTCVSQTYMSHLVSLIFEGVFERFPGLKFVFVEGGFAWLPHLMWRMDAHYKGLRQQAPWLKRLPSEYVMDHVRITTQPLEEPKKEEHLLQIFDMIDAENILMYASDYPHWDFDKPTVLPKKLSDTVRRKIMHDNAAALFKFS